jgi:hypothetical protein
LTHRLRSPRLALAFVYLVALAAALSSCTSTEPELISLTGRWDGSATGLDAGLFLTQSGNELSGSFTFHDLSNDGLGVCQLSGTYIKPSVTLIFYCGDLGPSGFDGSTTDGRSMTGTIVLSGRQYTSFTFALTEQ